MPRTRIHPNHKCDEEEVKRDEADGLPEVDLGAEIDIEEPRRGNEVEEDVAGEGCGVEREGRGVDGDDADDEGRDEGAGGEDGAEAGAGAAGSDGGDGGENVGGAVAEGEEGDGAHGGGEAEAGGEGGDDDGEVGVGGLDEEVEVQHEDHRQQGDGEEGVAAENAGVEVRVVE